jgi:hypothetical protein
MLTHPSTFVFGGVIFVTGCRLGGKGSRAGMPEGGFFKMRHQIVRSICFGTKVDAGMEFALIECSAASQEKRPLYR